MSFCESLFARDFRFPVLVGKVTPTATFSVLVVALEPNFVTSISVVLIPPALVEIEWVNLQHRKFINKRGFWMYITIIYVLK